MLFGATRRFAVNASNEFHVVEDVLLHLVVLPADRTVDDRGLRDLVNRARCARSHRGVDDRQRRTILANVSSRRFYKRVAERVANVKYCTVTCRASGFDIDADDGMFLSD